MKGTKYLLFIGIIALIAMSSCTIQKRVYSKGYHIEWNKTKHSTNNPKTEKDQLADQTEKSQPEQIAELEADKNETVDPSNQVESIDLASNDNTPPVTRNRDRSSLLINLKEKRIEIENAVKLNIPVKKRTNEEPDPDRDEEEEMSIPALLGLVFGVLIYVFSIGSIFIPFGFILVLACFLLSLILSIVGMVETSKGGKAGRGFAIAGLVLSIVYILLLVLAVVLLFLAFG